MAFPETIVDFPVMQDIDISDGTLIDEYQKAIQVQDIDKAASILAQIPDYDKKILTASYLNLISATVKALEIYYLEKYSPAIVVSSTQPIQAKTDLWFEITET